MRPGPRSRHRLRGVGLARPGKPLDKEVLSMRLGKEQAVGYVEDTGADSLPVQELAISQPDGLPLTPAPEGAAPESPVIVS